MKLACVVLSLVFALCWASKFQPYGGNVEVVECNSSDPNQKWTYNTTTHYFVNQGRCLDIESEIDDDGANVQLWDCIHDLRMNQMWTVKADGDILADQNDKCLSIGPNLWSTKANVIVSKCRGLKSQKWTVTQDHMVQSQMDPAYCLATGGLFPKSNAYHPLLIAHRGTCTAKPENTMMAFEYALANGMDAVETDPRFTKDGVIVLHHDGLLDTTTNCSGFISDKTYEELKYCDACSWFDKNLHCPIPTLEEVLRLVKKHNKMIVIDLKVDGLSKPISKMAKELNAERNCLISCWTDAQVEEFEENFPEASRHRLSTLQPLDYDMDYFWLEENKMGIHGYSVGEAYITEKFVKAAHDHMMDVVGWCPETEARILQAYDQGWDGIMTDSPEFLVQIVEKRRRQQGPVDNSYYFSPESVARANKDAHRTVRAKKN